MFRRWGVFLLLALVIFLLAHNLLDVPFSRPLGHLAAQPPFQWKHLTIRHPVESLSPLPTGDPVHIPRIQHRFDVETHDHKKEREQRLAAVKASFLHTWNGYKDHAWLQDEVAPLSGTYNNDFGGWGATLVDSLDTLWIMGMKREFAIAVKALRRIDFSSTPLWKVSVFETTIRYLGGLLSAYDLSGGQYPLLLEKAREVGEMLYVCFDTPNRMPIMKWDWLNAAQNGEQIAPSQVLLAEYGSLSLEFTRLSQLTGDPKYYDAIKRIMDVFEEQQNQTMIPGLWPVTLDASTKDFTKDRIFTFGASADSHYEYLPKQYLLLGGLGQQYRQMYTTAMAVAKERLFFRPLLPDNQNVLLSGTLKRSAAKNIKLEAQGQHLTCFVGGMVGLAAKIFEQEGDLDIARKLVDGCLWAYDSMPSGIMPELFSAKACANPSDCEWDETEWHKGIRRENSLLDSWKLTLQEHAQSVIQEKRLVPGFTNIQDPRYLLRPEAIESVFVLYRITGDQTLQDRAWKMFESIERLAKTDVAYASINDVTTKETVQFDSMESFWTGETLKYFFLTFSEPDVVSLDEYVLNTEAHPFKRPKP